jgi:hypothetical protein
MLGNYQKWKLIIDGSHGGLQRYKNVVKKKRNN